MIQSQLSPKIRENPFRVSRLNHSSDFRSDWDVETLNAAQSNWVLAEIELLAGRTTPDPGQLIPIFLSQPGYGKTHMFGRLESRLSDKAFFVFVGSIPDPKRILEHLRWTVVESLFRGENGRPTPLEDALAQLLVHSLIAYADRCNLNHDQQQHLIQTLDSPIRGTLEILGKSTTLASYQKLAGSISAKMPQARASVIRAMVMALSPEKHLARQWLRGERLSEEESRRLGIQDNAPNVTDVLSAMAALLEYKKPLVICFDQVESILKESEGPKQLGTILMDLLSNVPSQFLMISCFEQAWHDTYRIQLSEALLRRAKEFRLNFPSPKDALALVKKRLGTWPGYDPKRGEYFPFDSARLEKFALDEKPRSSQLIQLCEAAMDGWMNGKLKAPLSVSGELPVSEESLTTLFQRRWDEELAAVQQDIKRKTEEASDARIFAAMKEVVALVKSAGERWPGLHITLVKEPVLPEASTYPRYGMRVEIEDGGKKHSVIAGVTTMTSGNGLFHYVREFIRAIKTARGGVFLHPRKDMRLGQVGQSSINKEKKNGKIEILSLKEHADMFSMMECALGILQQAQGKNLALGANSISYEECQSLMLETGVLADLAFLRKLATWNSAAEGQPVAAAASIEQQQPEANIDDESADELAAAV